MELFCTAGRGTEAFVMREIQDRCRTYVEKVQTTDGKVFFTINSACPDTQNEVKQLKTVERLFVHVMTRKISPDNSTKRNLLTLMHTELNNRYLWTAAIDSLQTLKVERSGDLHLQQKNDSIFTKISKDIRTSISLNAGEREMSLQNTETSLKETVVDSVKGSTYKHILRSELTSRGKRPYDKTMKDSDSPSTVKKLCTDEKGHKCNKWTPTFRVSCKFTGSVRHKLKSQMSAKQMGVLISKLMGWRIQLKSPDLEICIHMNDDVMIVGIPVFRRPLARRDYIKHDGLRSTVCRIIAQLAGIRPGDVVLDPMCGKGVILLEALHLCQRAVYLGMDINHDQLAFAKENIDFKPEHQSIQIVQGNCLDLPIHDNCVDKIVTDGPFGKNHKTQRDLHEFYLNMLLEAFRVLKASGLMVLLTSTEITQRLYHTLYGRERSVKSIESEYIHGKHPEYYVKSTHVDKMLGLDVHLDKLPKIHECLNNQTGLFDRHTDSKQESNNGKLKQCSNNSEDTSPCLDMKQSKISWSRDNLMQQNSSDDIFRGLSNSPTKQHNRHWSINNKEENTHRTECNNSVSVVSCCNICNPDKFSHCAIIPAKSPCLTCKYKGLKDKFTIVSCDYVKLGETDGYICVLLSNKEE